MSFLRLFMLILTHLTWHAICGNKEVCITCTNHVRLNPVVTTPMIQWPIHNDSLLLRSWMNQPDWTNQLNQGFGVSFIKNFLYYIRFYFILSHLGWKTIMVNSTRKANSIFGSYSCHRLFVVKTQMPVILGWLQHELSRHVIDVSEQIKRRKSLPYADMCTLPLQHKQVSNISQLIKYWHGKKRSLETCTVKHC